MIYNRLFLALAAFALFPIAPMYAQFQKPWLDFPTDNRTLITGKPSDFYMYVHRDFQGRRSTPWQGGQYGYVRGPKIQGKNTIYVAMHEGLDIKPLHRDAQGEPLDVVKAAADGVIVHVSNDPRASNYGRYIVIEHPIHGSNYYTLYAHLASTKGQVGQAIKQGTPLGIIGHSGEGLDRERAHVHFEFCLLLTENFDAWSYAMEPPSANKHGNFNGRNLAGFDPSKLLRAAQTTPASELPALIAAEEPCFKIHVPNSSHFDLIRRYPWLLKEPVNTPPPAWTITFSKHQVPIKVESHAHAISKAQLASIQRSSIPYVYLTRGIVAGSADSPRLTEAGEKFAQRLTFPD